MLDADTFTAFNQDGVCDVPSVSGCVFMFATADQAMAAFDAGALSSGQYRYVRNSRPDPTCRCLGHFPMIFLIKKCLLTGQAEHCQKTHAIDNYRLACGFVVYLRT